MNFFEAIGNTVIVGTRHLEEVGSGIGFVVTWNRNLTLNVWWVEGAEWAHNNVRTLGGHATSYTFDKVEELASEWLSEIEKENEEGD